MVSLVIGYICRYDRSSDMYHFLLIDLKKKIDLYICVYIQWYESYQYWSQQIILLKTKNVRLQWGSNLRSVNYYWTHGYSHHQEPTLRLIPSTTNWANETDGKCSSTICTLYCHVMTTPSYKWPKCMSYSTTMYIVP